MSEPEETRVRRWSKVLNKQLGEQWPVFTGDFETLNEVLVDKPSNSPWLFLQFLNALCRSFGQVIFANNPISGAFVMLAIGIANYHALLAGIYASTLSFIFALLFRQDSCAILNGGYGYNPVLHGVVSIAALPSIYPEIDSFPPRFWLFLLVTTILSIYVTSALSGLLKHMGRYPVPCFTLPFNLVQFLLIYALLNNSMPSQILHPHFFEAPGLQNFTRNQDHNGTSQTINISTTVQDNLNTSGEVFHLNWGETFSGTIVALAQVYGINNVPCAALMYLALFVFSPIMTGFAYLGSLLGTILGVLFANTPEEIYTGVWGYNGLLCSAALGGFCLVLNMQSTAIAIASIFFTTALQHILTPLFVLMNFPILTMPFNLTTILFLFVSTEKEETLSRPLNLSFPEKHREENQNSARRPMEGYLRRSQIYDGKEEI